ncbi:hypothetical protein G1H11_04170 [Phytoactinopolyspora alkaliphila]|uniref:Uncharacterized protein n=1 Tax=Phytoactinopolyspora alkaliphila TaxID=1783498 RepID=A0A6N9YHG7_9ACTN|nr:hypothetical protein [Phytoactinopolyspora alkaliphila]
MLYIVIAYFYKPILLNWIIGPLFMLITLHIIPTLLRGLRDKVRMRFTG